jgi:hypothetical protein
VWYCIVEDQPLTILWDSDGTLQIWEGPHAVMAKMLKETLQELAGSIQLIETWGTSGLAETDPMWDGRQSNTSKNPKCSCFGRPKDVHQNVAEILYQRSQELKSDA